MSHLGDIIDVFDALTLEGKNRVVQPPTKIMRNASIIHDCLSHIDVSNWENIDENTAHELVELSRNSAEYRALERKFKSTSPLRDVLQIERVQNPLLYVQYNLKVKQKKTRYGIVSEHTLFHGTQDRNVESICRNNFDWRKLGSSGYRSSKFGCGVSFSPTSSYASGYPRGCHSSVRVMLVAKVLEVARCRGVPGLVIPPEPADSSAKPDGDVLVKYFDNEFYPEYVIRYT